MNSYGNSNQLERSPLKIIAICGILGLYILMFSHTLGFVAREVVNWSGLLEFTPAVFFTTDGWILLKNSKFGWVSLLSTVTFGAACYAVYYGVRRFFSGIIRFSIWIFSRFQDWRAERFG